MEYGLEKLTDAVYRAQKGDERGCGGEIVFIHGLQIQENKNAYFETWLSADGRDLWPKSWLSESFPTAAIYLVHYDSSTGKNEKSGRLDMFATAENLLQNFLLAGIGQSPRNPVVLIGKDVGGLVIKEICLQASSGASTSDLKQSTAHKKRSFLKQVKGVFYFSTPHGGLPVWDPGYQGELMKILRVHNAATARSNEAFRKLRMEYKWRAYGLGASLPDHVEVEEGSSRQDVDNFCMIDANTTNMCRMKDRTSTSFAVLENFIRETVSGFQNRERVKLQFISDPRYVPLTETVRGIRDRLESADVQVVVLCGDAGTGKSSLAKYLAFQYEKEEETGLTSAFWDGIFYFECKRGTDAVTVLPMMLRELRVDQQTISMYSDEAGMCFLLRNRLQNLNALMIFDDVCEDHREKFIEKVVVPEAKEVKYLLTSQQSDVWRGYDICPIESISLNLAQAIVAKHAGLQAGIAEEDKVIVNKIITALEFHPLALATVSSSVQKGSTPSGVVPRPKWEQLRQNLSAYLNDDNPGAKPIAFGKLYPWTVYAAMMNAVDLLYSNKRNNDERLQLELMCIMASFESPLPTSVLHMFTLCTKPALSSQVSRLLKRLQGRTLVLDTLAKVVMPSQHIFTLVRPWDMSVQVALPCIKMHSLRQRFILSCAYADSPGSDAAKFIKETVVSLSDFERHSEPLALSTALLALYGEEKAKEAARGRLWPQLKILVPESPGNQGRCVEVLETLMWKIEEYGTTQSILSALQKVVWKYMFELQLDDDNISSLISGGYDGALPFLASYCEIRGFRTRGCEMMSSIPRSLLEAINLLRSETHSNLTILSVLALVYDVASTCTDGSYPSYLIDVFDLEVLIKLLHRVHNFALVFPSLVIQNLFILTRIERVKMFQWTSLLRTRPSLQEIIKSVIMKVVVDLTHDVSEWSTGLEDEGREYPQFELCFEDEALEIIPKCRVNFQVRAVFDAMELLCELQTFGEEEFRATVQSISGPLQAIVRSFQQASDLYTLLGLTNCRRFGEIKLQGGRSAVWSMPGVIEGIVSLVCRPKIQRRSRPRSTVLALRTLRDWIRSDDGVRSLLFKHEGFLEGLVEVIGDHRHQPRGDADIKRSHDPHVIAVRIIETFVTRDETAASVLVSLPNLCQVLCDLVLTDEDPETQDWRSVKWWSALTVLFYLGYSVVEITSDYQKTSRHRRPVTPQRSQRTVDVPNAFENLLDVIHRGRTVQQIYALDFLLYLLVRHPRARARIYAIPTAAARLAPLVLQVVVDTLVPEEVYNDLKHMALKAILFLSGCSESDLAIGFIRQIVLIPGVVDRILDLIKLPRVGDVLGMGFVCRYLEVEPENSSHISAIRDIVRDMVVSVKNKPRLILLCLQQFSQESKNISVFLSIRGSVEAMVELLSHQLVELQLVAVEKERTELAHLTDTCFSVLHKLVTSSEQATSRIVAMGTGRVLHMMLDLLDRKQPQTVQMRTLDFLFYLARRSNTYDAVFQMMEGGDFIDRFSLLLQSADPGDLEKGKWFVMNFPFVLASIGRRSRALPEEIIELVSGALQDCVSRLTDIDREKVPRALESLLSFVDLLTNINGKQVPTVLNSLLSLVKDCEMLRASILDLRASLALKSLISLSMHHRQGSERASALHILRVSCADVLFDKEFTPCLAEVLVDALPGILSQLEFEGRESAAVQVSAVQLVDLLSRIGEHYSVGTTSFVRTKLKSLILYNPQVLQNLTGLLLRDELDCIHEHGIAFLWLTALGTAKGMSLIVQIPGTLERIAEFACRGFYPACHLLHQLIIIGEAGPYALQYLSKCLALVISINTGKNSKVVSEALKLLERCALQNNKTLRYLIDLLHETVRYRLRTAAMSYLINYASDSTSPEPPRRTVLVSLQSLAYGLDRDDYSKSVYEVQMEVLCVLDSLVKSSFHNQLRMAKCMTGIYAYELQMYMHMSRSMDSCCTSLSYLWSMLSTMAPSISME